MLSKSSPGRADMTCARFRTASVWLWITPRCKPLKVRSKTEHLSKPLIFGKQRQNNIWNHLFILTCFGEKWEVYENGTSTQIWGWFFWLTCLRFRLEWSWGGAVEPEAFEHHHLLRNETELEPVFQQPQPNEALTRSLKRADTQIHTFTQRYLQAI